LSKKIFVSHSTDDSKMIHILLEFLNNIGIENEDIFCTSIGNVLESGKNFVDQIKVNVQDSKVVIVLLTERFFLSYFCLTELGAAWALNQNILPIIVPPISPYTEYNRTPLIGIHALNMGSENFAEELFNDLVRKNAIDKDSTINRVIFNDFNIKIKKEIKILRKDSHGFYIARLLDHDTHPELGNVYRLNGLLEIECDSSIAAHWIVLGSLQLSSKKLQFELVEPIAQSEDNKLFMIKNFYELP
jgi:TIR domain.